jgi:hypothetical protein
MPLVFLRGRSRWLRAGGRRDFRQQWRALWHNVTGRGGLRDEIAEAVLLELNPDIRITDEQREMILAELDRHIASITAIAAADTALSI